jgi:hypothetical protein
MKKIIFTTVIALASIFSVSINAQSSFHKKIAASGYSLTISKVKPLNDGGYIACGDDKNFTPNPLIIKADVSGQITWVRAISSPSVFGAKANIDVGECVGGGYYFFSSGFGATIYYLTKMDVSGNVLWTKEFVFGDSPYTIPKVFQKPNGDFVIIPSFYTWTGIITMDANGNFLWGKMFSDDSKCPGFAGASCNDGGYIVSGKDGSDIFLVKMDASGTVQWSSRYQDVNLYSHPRILLRTQDGNYFIAGLRSIGTQSNAEAFAMKIDASGNTLWHKTYSSGTTDYSYFFESAVEMQNGEIVLLNSHEYSDSSSVVTKIGPGGDLVYAKKIGVANEFGYYSKSVRSVAKAGNDLLLSGDVYDGSAHSGFIMRTNASGNNFGCEVSNLSVTVTALPAIPKLTPTFNITNISAPNSVIFETSEIVFSTANLCEVVGVNESSNNAYALEIFPNPSSDGKFTLHNESGDISMIEVYDLQGKRITSMDASKTDVILIDLSAHSKGVYLVKSSGEKGIRHSKIVLE